MSKPECNFLPEFIILFLLRKIVWNWDWRLYLRSINFLGTAVHTFLNGGQSISIGHKVICFEIYAFVILPQRKVPVVKLWAHTVVSDRCNVWALFHLVFNSHIVIVILSLIINCLQILIKARRSHDSRIEVRSFEIAHIISNPGVVVIFYF